MALRILRSDMTSPPILAVLDGSYWLLPSERCLAEQDTISHSETFLSDEESYTLGVVLSLTSFDKIFAMSLGNPDFFGERTPSKRASITLSPLDGQVPSLRVRLTGPANVLEQSLFGIASRLAGYS